MYTIRAKDTLINLAIERYDWTAFVKWENKIQSWLNMFIQDNFVSKAQGYSNKKLILDVQVYRYLNNFRSNSAQRKMPFSTPAERIIVCHYKQSLT